MKRSNQPPEKPERFRATASSKHAVQGRRHWRKVHLAMDLDPMLVGLALDYDGSLVSDTGDVGVRGSYAYTFSGVDSSRIGREIRYDDDSQATDVFMGEVLQTCEGRDLADANQWNIFVTTYDASGNVTSRVTVFDDGRTATNTCSGGAITSRVVEDVNDANDWHRIDVTYDASGNVESRSFVWVSDLPIV